MSRDFYAGFGVILPVLRKAKEKHLKPLPCYEAAVEEAVSADPESVPDYAPGSAPTFGPGSVPASVPGLVPASGQQSR